MHAYNPRIQEVRQNNFKLKANVGHKASTRTVWTSSKRLKNKSKFSLKRIVTICSSLYSATWIQKKKSHTFLTSLNLSFLCGLKQQLGGINGPGKDRTEEAVEVPGAREELLDYCEAGLVLFDV